MELLFDSDSDEEVIPVRQRRHFKERINFTHLNNFQFKESFRISPEAFEYVLQRIGPALQHTTSRNYALTPSEQLQSALHWFGNGCQYHGLGDMHGVSKSTIHRCIYRVCNALLDTLFPSTVRWPEVHVADVPQKFMALANFPRVAGCVDGTLIRIDGPTENEPAFVDRHGDHSLNAMVVAGPDLEFFYASCKWPGSVSDARVLRNSSLFVEWEQGWRPFPNAVLLGDSIYPLKTWLMTPLANGERTRQLNRYLRAHKSTRRIVECAIGILKEKFPCLNYMRLAPIAAGKVFLSCVTLHNIEKRFRTDENYLVRLEDFVEEEFVNVQNADANDAAAVGVYNNLVEYFNY